MNSFTPKLFGTILLSLLKLYALAEELNFQRNISWQNDTVFNSCSGTFKEAFFNPIFEGLPCLHLDHFIDDKASSIDRVEITNANFQSFQCTDVRLQNYLKPDWNILARITDARGKYYLDLTVLPFRKINGQLEKLVSFSINVRYSQTPNFQSSRDIQWLDHSALKDGEWYKLAISKDGVYKIDKNQLAAMGVNTSNVNPQFINIYGNGGQLLPELNSEPRPDDLMKCSIFIEGEGDGVFDNGDYILFYGKGADSWQIDAIPGTGRRGWLHKKHYYSDSAYYFLRINDSQPKRIQIDAQQVGTPQYVSTTFQDFQFVETELYNLVQSGREFYGDKFEQTLSREYNFNFPFIRTDYPTTIHAGFAIRSVGSASSFSLISSGVSTTSNSVTSGTGSLASTATKVNVSATVNTSNPSVGININFNKAANSIDAQGYLDFINVNATRDLSYNGTQLHFRDSNNVGDNSLTQFELQNSNGLHMIWDITDYVSPKKIEYTVDGTTTIWKSATNELKEFIAFPNFNFLIPTSLGKIANQDLHGTPPTDLVIVSAPAHLESARQLADIHASEGMRVLLVTQAQVFNEFSSGNPDVTAIRMLMKMLYDKAEGNDADRPDNLLLFGDGNYANNRGYRAFNGSNVMLFESDESLGPVTSYVSDDYFVMLSDNDNASPTGLLDAGVGRIPAGNSTMGLEYVDKVRQYLALNNSPTGDVNCIGEASQNSFGPWRNLLSFISDDQDGSGGANEQIHLDDANTLADRIYNEHPDYDVSKIYMDAYVQQSTPGGERYPDGERAIREQIKNGALIVTYLGHGGERGWAHERILDVNTISNFTNINNLPLFLTATCELARFDNPEYFSAGERLAMNSTGGAIALLTTTRVVFAGSNMQMDMAFFDVALFNDTISDLTLGKINMLTKNGVPVSNSSKPNFSLLGDPALRLRYPKYEVVTTHINGSSINTSLPDTIKALQEVEMWGHISDAAGNKLDDYNGFIYPVVYDKISTVKTLNNDFDGNLGESQSYNVYNKVIFKGKSTVSRGDFKFKFVVPLDINYSVGSGRVSYYGLSGSEDAHGYFQNVFIGSSLSGSQLNKVGPDIKIYFNDTTFVSGGVSNTSPILIARLKDDNGINTIANSIGHDIVAILDDDTQNPIILNNYYLSDLDTYKSGEIRYQLENLESGNHTLKIRAWDVHNNSNTESIDFVVEEDANIAIEHLLNYPNPFTTSTKFMFEHNQACRNLDILIQIYTVSGKLVKTIEQAAYQTGFRATPILWDGRDDFGDRIGKGVYMYRLSVKNEKGESAELYEKLVILK
jgi:hypothetical protein